MKQTLFAAAIICAIIFGQATPATARHHHQKDAIDTALDKMEYVMKHKERKIVKKLHNEVVAMIPVLRQKLIEKNVPLTFNASYDDTAYFYDYKNIRIGKTEQWLMLGDTPSVKIADAKSYFYMEGHQIECVKPTEEVSFYYLQALNNIKAIMPEHFHIAKSTMGDYDVYAFDGNPTENAYQHLVVALNDFKTRLQTAIDQN